MGYGDHHILFGNQILNGELSLISNDLAASCIAETLDNIVQLRFQDLEPLVLGCENAFELLD